MDKPLPSRRNPGTRLNYRGFRVRFSSVTTNSARFFLSTTRRSSKTRLDEAETGRQRLYQKQGRNARFRSKKERDDWLQDQINDTSSSLSTVEAVRMQTSEDIKERERDIAKLELEVDGLQDQINGRGDAVAGLDRQIQAAKEER